jgi:hypothetical protein
MKSAPKSCAANKEGLNMRRSIKYCLLMSLAFTCVAQTHANGASPQSLVLGPNSAVWLVGDSTLHPFTSRSGQLQIAASINAQADASGGSTPPFESILNQGALKTFDLTIPVNSLKSKESALDKNLYKDLKADTCPAITFHLTDYAVSKDTMSADGYVGKVNGTLTIACQQKPITLETKLAPVSGQLHVQGYYPLLMTDYGVKPPTMMMGSIKVKDQVLIHFDLQLGSTNP